MTAHQSMGKRNCEWRICSKTILSDGLTGRGGDSNPNPPCYKVSTLTIRQPCLKQQSEYSVQNPVRKASIPITWPPSCHQAPQPKHQWWMPAGRQFCWDVGRRGSAACRSGCQRGCARTEEGWNSEVFHSDGYGGRTPEGPDGQRSWSDRKNERSRAIQLLRTNKETINTINQ